MLLSRAAGFGVSLTSAQADFLLHDWKMVNAAIVTFWTALQSAMLAAVQGQAGERHRVGRLTVYRRQADDTLRIRLPSQRELIYHQPRMTPDPDRNDRLGLSYQQVDGDDWHEVRSWFGRSTENVVQAVARDLLTDAMLRIEAAGIEIVGCLHDEVIALAPRQRRRRPRRHRDDHVGPAGLGRRAAAGSRGLPRPALRQAGERWRRLWSMSDARNRVEVILPGLVATVATVLAVPPSFRARDRAGVIFARSFRADRGRA